MASTLAGARNTRNLMCGICKDVYRSPRILPCFHTFCLHCIEGLTRTHGHRFPCPQCRRTVQLPPEGPQGLQVNFYLDEEQLELARKGPGNTICPVHSQDMEPIVFFCNKCDTALCLRCKLTEHEGHKTEDISKAAKRCGKRLKDSKTQLEESIDLLTKKSKQAHEEAKAVKIKESAMEEQVILQGDVLKAMVDQAVKESLENLKNANNRTVQQVEATSCSIQNLLDSHTRLSQDVNRALEGADADKVCVEREMRDGAGNCEDLKAAIDSVPNITVRTVLRSSDNVSLGRLIKGFIGAPETTQFESQVQQETATLFVQLVNDHPCRRIHSLICKDHWIHVSAGGMAPDYNEANMYRVMTDGTHLSLEHLKIGKCSFQLRNENKCVYTVYNSTSNFNIFSKSHAAQYNQKEGKCTIFSETATLSETTNKVVHKKSQIILKKKTGQLIAFAAAASDGKMFAVIVESKVKRHGTTRKLHLLDSTCSQPVATYDPPGDSFFPVDVCFWRVEDETKLLIADFQNDLVHVVNTADKQLQFDRYLAPGSGLLVRPTALSVDEEERVLIGCDNGKILRLDKVVRQEPGCAMSVETPTSSLAGDLAIENASQ